MSMLGPINDPAAWQAWLAHLKEWGWTPQGTHPGALQDLGPPAPANTNQKFWAHPVSQLIPGTTINSMPDRTS